MLKKHLLLFFAVLLFFICGTGPVWAVPNLQIWSPQATSYDGTTETWIIPSSSYELYIVGANRDIYDVKIAFAVPETTDPHASIEVTWLDLVDNNNDNAPDLDDYGNFITESGFADYDDTSLQSLTMTEDGDDMMDYYTEYWPDYSDGSLTKSNKYGFEKYEGVDGGIPLDGSGKTLPPGDIFPSSFYEYYIGDFTPEYPVRNYFPGEENDYATGMVKIFQIDVTGYEFVNLIAYDHWVKSNGKAQYVKTPYSHDGMSVVPEPAMMLLLGTGMIGLALGRYRRHRR